MTDRKHSAADGSDDELFDHASLANSDSDFLAELDRVLADEAEPGATDGSAPRADEVAEQAESPTPAEPAFAGLESFSEPEDDRELPDDLSAFRPGTTLVPETPEHSDSLELELELDELDEDVVELAGTGFAAADVAAEARMPEVPVYEKPDEPANPAAAEPPDFTDAERTVHMEPAPAKPSTIAEPLAPNPEPEPPAAPAPNAGGPVVSGAPLAASESSAVTTVHVIDDNSSMWSGMAALLALVGIGVGAAALWNGAQLGTRLHDAPASAMATQLRAAGPDPRLGALEQRLNRLEAKPAAMPTNTQPIDVLEQRLTEELERLGGQLSSLHELAANGPRNTDETIARQLRVITDRLDDMDERLQAVTQQASLASSATRPQTATTKPASRDGGAWAVNLLSFQLLEKAESERKRLRVEGMDVEIRTVESKGKTWHRLMVSGFPDVKAAKAYADEVRQKPEFSSAWIGRN